MDSLSGMRLFLRVVQLGSFSAAARQSGVSPASVFRAINALEDTLGAKLLNRTSRRLTLTEAGRLYVERLDPILAELDGLRGAVGQLQATPRGTLRVLCRVSFGNRHLAPLLPDFLTRHPDLKLDLLLSDRNVDLVEQNIDVALRVGDITGAGLLKRKLVSSPRVLCASPDYLATRQRPERPKDIAAQNCLTFRSDEAQPIWRFLKDGNLSEIRVTGSLQSDSSEVLRQAALRGLGIVLLPTWMVGPDLAGGRLVPLMQDYVATGFGFDDAVYVVTQKARYRSLKVQLFIDFCIEHLRGRRSW